MHAARHRSLQTSRLLHAWLRSCRLWLWLELLILLPDAHGLGAQEVAPPLNLARLARRLDPAVPGAPILQRLVALARLQRGGGLGLGGQALLEELGVEGEDRLRD